MTRSRIIAFLIAVIAIAGLVTGGWFAWELGWIAGNPRSPREENFEVALHRVAGASSGYPHELCVQPALSPEPQRKGKDGIAFDTVPGAYSVAFRVDAGGTMRDRQIAQFELLANAGFFTAKDTTLELAGSPVPAREFDLTWEGFSASAGRGCFYYGRRDKVEVLAFEKRKNEAGVDVYEVRYRVLVGRPEKWASGQEFKEAWPQAGKELEGAILTTQLLRGETGWITVLELQKAAAVPKDLEKLALIAGPLTKENLTRRLAAAERPVPPRLASCLMLPMQADETIGLGTGNPKEPFVATFVNRLDREPSRNQELLRDYELMRRLERAGFAKAELLEVFDYKGYPAKGAVRFTLDQAIKLRIDPQTTHCLPLGRARMTVLALRPRLGGSVPTSYDFVGRAVFEGVEDWLKKVAQQFPHVAFMINEGLAVTGTVSLQNGQWTPYPMPKPLGFMPDVSKIVLPVVQPPSGAQPPRRVHGAASTERLVAVGSDVGFLANPSMGRVTNEGTTASHCCAGPSSVSFASRAHRTGKWYLEAVLSTGPLRETGTTWINVGVVTEVRTDLGVSAKNVDGIWLIPFSQGGTFKAGDVFGIAMDLDSARLYYHVNGSWRTGQPDSGLGLNLARGRDYRLAVQATSDGDSWTANFGKKAFQLGLPRGYRSYDARRVAEGAAPVSAAAPEPSERPTPRSGITSDRKTAVIKCGRSMIVCDADDTINCGGRILKCPIR